MTTGSMALTVPKVRSIAPRLLLLGALLAASGAVAAQKGEEVAIAALDAEATAVIAFLPPAARESGNAADIDARTQVGVAIADAKRCLGEGYAHYQVVFSDRIVIRRTGREETFQVSDFAPLVGALLVRRGTNARILFAGAGPEALVQLLPSAASEYFGKECVSR